MMGECSVSFGGGHFFLFVISFSSSSENSQPNVTAGFGLAYGSESLGGLLCYQEAFVIFPKSGSEATPTCTNS